MGRYSYSHRDVLEYSAGITIQDLINFKVFNKGDLTAKWTFGITHTRGVYTEKLTDVKFTVKIQEDNSYIQFQYDYKDKPLNFYHPIIRQPVHFGGYRYYFVCSCSKDGVYCGRRVKALYFGGRVWACRHCLELVYMNCRYNRDILRYKNNSEILQKKAEKLKLYGHHRKANRLFYKAYEYEVKHDQAFNREFARRFVHLL